jgi:PadR family transcriptional regulator PadR
VKILSISHEFIYFNYQHEPDMNIENAQVQMRKGILEFCILHIISRGEVYASDMLDELTAARIMVVEGTLYPLLTRLKNSGWLDYKWVESSSGPPRKYYVLTDEGKIFLDAMQTTWFELADSVQAVIHRTEDLSKTASNPS